MRRTIAIAIAPCVALAVGAVVAPAGSAALAPQNTTVTLQVRGCDGCEMTANRYDTATQGDFGTKPVTVVDGVAEFVVPTAQTVGMYFTINTDPPARIDALPVVVVQYRGVRPGTTITKALARASRKASGCWAGTTAANVTIAVTVRRITMQAFPDGSKRTRVPLAFFQPGAKALGGFDEPTDKGLIATQDVWTCGKG